MLRYLESFDIDILDVLYCPHLPSQLNSNYGVTCNCRKPAPGMFFMAAHKHLIDLTDSIMIGDKETDLLAAANAGIQKRYLICSEKDNLKSIMCSGFYNNLLSCVKSIL